MDLKPGCLVRQKVHVIAGVVVPNGIRWNPGQECFEVLVAYKDAASALQERWFLEGEVEKVGEVSNTSAAVEVTLTAQDVGDASVLVIDQNSGG